MIVYADQARTLDPRLLLTEIRQGAERATEAPPGVVRHDRLVTLLIEAGQLAQGLADAEWLVAGRDGPSRVQEAAMALVMTLARRVWTSWISGFRSSGQHDGSVLEALAAQRLPARITVKQPEGFAYYALYPEAYGEAGRGLPPDTRVIGLRSIGTTLAAMAAVGAGAAAPITLRPGGPPFRRCFDVDPALLAGLSPSEAKIALVDEGPGLSGSSLNGLADLLEIRGVPPERIVFLPGHAGPLGPEAAPAHRRRWADADRRVVPFETLVLPRLAEAVEDLTGPALGLLDDLSGGAWRSHLPLDRGDWPPVHAMQERRKFLLRSRSGLWLLKFVGLGRLSAEAFTLASKLHEAGFAPRPLGVRLGILVLRWEEAVPANPEGEDRPRFIETIGRYLGLRASMPAEAAAGADLASLGDMARANIREALGDAAAAAWSRRAAGLAPVNAPCRVLTDNRMQAWEWLRTPDGVFLKADGLDHHRAHDLIGCQDIAWDIAGATVALRLAPHEIDAIVSAVEQASGRAVDRRLLGWLYPVALAFEIGRWSLAAGGAGTDERQRIDALLACHQASLRHWLAGP